MKKWLLRLCSLAIIVDLFSVLGIVIFGSLKLAHIAPIFAGQALTISIRMLILSSGFLAAAVGALLIMLVSVILWNMVK